MEMGQAANLRPEQVGFVPSTLPVLGLNPFGVRKPLSLPLSMNQLAANTVQKSKVDH